jgi:hypothetical protein
MRSEVPPFLGCSLRKRCHGYLVYKQAQAVSPTRLHALCLILRSGSICTVLDWAGLDLPGLAGVWTENRESHSSTLARAIANDVLHPGLLLYAQGSSNICGRWKLTNM